jgi:hypothetical protein
MRRGLHVPAPGRGRQPFGHSRRKVSRVGGLHHRPRRRSRVEVDRDPQSLRALQDRPEKTVVQVAAPGMPVDQRTHETVFPYRTLQLIRGGFWCRRRERREPGQATGVTPHRRRKYVVYPAR